MLEVSARQPKRAVKVDTCMQLSSI